jgi:hypothetical protein
MQMDISQRLSSIRQALVAKSDEKAKGAFRKFIPTSQNVYGVRVPLLNQLAKEHREVPHARSLRPEVKKFNRIAEDQVLANDTLFLFFLS